MLKLNTDSAGIRIQFADLKWNICNAHSGCQIQ